MFHPVSAAWQAAVAGGPGQLTVQCTILSDGVQVLGPIPVETATVTVDRTQAQRTTVSVTFTGLTGTETYIPTDLTSPVAPNGNELALQAGFTYPDGTVELIQVGVFPIQTTTVTDTGTDLTLQVTGADRSWSISRRALLTAYTVASGETVDQAIHDLLTANTSGLPAFSYSITNTTVQAPAGNTYDVGQDPWQAATDLASGAGFELFFDRFGNCQALPIPDPTTLPVGWTSVDAATGGGMLSVTRTLTGVSVANDFIVSASNTSTTPPVQAEAADDNPSSPTYVGGPYGDIPSFTTSSTATDVPGCQAAANAALTASLGEIDTHVLEVLNNPAVDVDDIFSVTRSRAGLTGELVWVVDGYTLNLAVGGTMTVNLRRVI